MSDVTVGEVINYDLCWDGNGTPDFTRGHPKDSKIYIPGFLELLGRLHNAPRPVEFDGLESYDGDMQQVLLDVDTKIRGLPSLMCALDTAYFSDRPWRATKVKPITKTTYRATLIVHGGQNVEVIVKFAFGMDDRDELAKEALFYMEELAQLQGKVVPQYVGIFSSSGDRTGYPTPLMQTCLILTYVGQGLGCPFKELEPQMRGAIFNAILTLHDHGIQHCDLHEGNFRIDLKTERAWIIDFESARKHKCNHPPIKYGSPSPQACDFDCRELHFWGLLTKIWIDYGKITFCNVPVYLEYIETWEDLLCFVPGSKSDEEAERLAKEGFVQAEAKKLMKFEKYREENNYFLSLGKEFADRLVVQNVTHVKSPRVIVT